MLRDMIEGGSHAFDMRASRRTFAYKAAVSMLLGLVYWRGLIFG